MKPIAYYLQIGAAISGLYVGLIYIFYNWRRGLFHRLLGTNFIIMSFGLIVNFVAINNYFPVLPHLSRTGFIFVFLMPPILYFSIFRGLLKKAFQPLDLLHLLPLFIYLINYYPYFIKSGEEKIAILNLNNLGSFNEGWLLPGYFIPALNCLQTIFYIILFIKKTKELKDVGLPNEYLQFFYYFTGYLFIHFIPLYLMIFGYYNNRNVESIIPIAYALANTVFFLKVISTPEWIFNKLDEKEYLPSSKNATNIEELLAQIELKLSPRIEELNDLEQKFLKNILTLCQNNLLFLNADFQQKTLAKELDCSEYKLRALLDKAYGLNFVEFNNYLKIKYFFVNYKKREGSWKLLKMNVISGKLGYKSLNSFYLNFKKITGVTPGDFFNSNKVDSYSKPTFRE